MSDSNVTKLNLVDVSGHENTNEPCSSAHAATGNKKGPKPKYESDEDRRNAIKGSQERYRVTQKKFGLRFYQRAVTKQESEILDSALNSWREKHPLPPEMFVRKSRRGASANK